MEEVIKVTTSIIEERYGGEQARREAGEGGGWRGSGCEGGGWRMEWVEKELVGNGAGVEGSGWRRELVWRGRGMGGGGVEGGGMKNGAGGE